MAETSHIEINGRVKVKFDRIKQIDTGVVWSNLCVGGHRKQIDASVVLPELCINGDGSADANDGNGGVYS